MLIKSTEKNPSWWAAATQLTKKSLIIHETKMTITMFTRTNPSANTKEANSSLPHHIPAK